MVHGESLQSKMLGWFLTVRLSEYVDVFPRKNIKKTNRGPQVYVKGDTKGCVGF